MEARQLLQADDESRTLDTGADAMYHKDWLVCFRGCKGSVDVSGITQSGKIVLLWLPLINSYSV